MQPKNVLVVALVLIAMAGPIGHGSAAVAQEVKHAVAQEILAPGELTLVPENIWERAILKLSGSGGQRLRQTFAAGEEITVRLVDKEGQPFADGRYKYHLRLFTPAERSPRVQTSVFDINNGVAAPRQEKRAELATVRRDLNQMRGSQLGVVPPSPQLGGEDDIFYVYDAANDGITRLTLDSDAGLVWDFYNWNGDLRIQRFPLTATEPALSIDGTSNRVGIGTTSPSGNLDVRDDVSPEIYLYEGPGVYAEIQLTGSGLFVEAAEYGRVEIYAGLGEIELDVDNAFVHLTADSRRFGVDTRDPESDIDVRDMDGNDFAAMRLNNGIATWAFSNTDVGVFTVNKIGSGGQEFSVNTRNNGAGVATMQVQGSVSATMGHVRSSSRDLKTDFATVDGKEVLSKLAELPVMSWRYKSEDETARHLGPVAEDFQAAFQLGDGKTITDIDADGVEIAAIQGLHELLLEKEAEIRQLRAEKDRQIGELKRRLSALEEQLPAPAPGG